MQRKQLAAKVEYNKASTAKDKKAKLPEHKSKQKNENWSSRFALHINIELGNQNLNC
jgi:hypothetical protein